MSVLHCQGFLEALAMLNGEASDLCASYELQRLPDAPDLATALGLRVEGYALNVIEPARDLPAALWHVNAAPPGRFRAQLVAAFIESLDDALGGFSLHAVTMTPPAGFWYAIHWDEIAFELGG